MKKLLLTLACILGIGLAAHAETKTITFADRANGVVAETISDQPLTVTFAKNDGTTAPTFYTTGLRLYYDKNNGNGSGFTITCDEGYVLTNVSFTIDGNYGWPSNACGSVGTMDGDNWSSSGVSSVTFKNTNIENKQVRIASMVITYEEGEDSGNTGGGSTDPGENPNPGPGEDPTPAPEPTGTVAYVAEGYTYTGNAVETVTISGTQTAGQSIMDKNWTAPGVCSLVFTKVNSNVSYVTGNVVRWYQGDKITITPEAGVTITGIKMVSGTTNPVCANGESKLTSINDIAWTAVSNTEATWTGTLTEAFTFSNSAQVRFQYIEVSYFTEEGEGLKSAGLSFPAPQFTATLGESFTAPELTKATDAQVFYSSTNDAVASVDVNTGDITVKSLGQTVITAQTEENKVYAAGKATYTLTVAPKEGTVITVAEALKAIENGYNAEAQVKGIISKIDEIETVTYGNATYFIKDDLSDENALEIYRGYWLNGEKFVNGNEIEEGGIITVSGTLVSFNGTPEFTTGSKVVEYQAPAPTTKSVTLNFSGMEDAYKYITIMTMDEDGEPIELTGNTYTYEYENQGGLMIAAAEGYEYTFSCDQEMGEDTYVFIGSTPMAGYEESNVINGMLGLYGADNYTFNFAVSAIPAEEPETATVNFVIVGDASALKITNADNVEIPVADNKASYTFEGNAVLTFATPITQNIMFWEADLPEGAMTYVEIPEEDYREGYYLIRYEFTPAIDGYTVQMDIEGSAPGYDDGSGYVTLKLDAPEGFDATNLNLIYAALQEQIQFVDGEANFTWAMNNSMLLYQDPEGYTVEFVAPEGMQEGINYITGTTMWAPSAEEGETAPEEESYNYIKFVDVEDGSVFTVKVTEIAEEPTYPEAVYIVGNGVGMTWDLPGQEVKGENGVYTLNLTGVSSFKVSTVNTTDWDTFDAAAYATGNTDFGDEVGSTDGQTLPVEIWGQNQDLPWKGDYTITLDLVNETMNAYTATPKPVEAPAVYIRGGMNNWGSVASYQLTNESWDATAQTGVFTWEGKISAGQNFKIGDDSWGAVNYGGAQGIKANESIDLTYNGSDMNLANDFDGKVTFSITGSKQATVIFEMEGEAPAPETMYVIGTINGEAWNPTNVAEMTVVSDGVYQIENVKLAENSGSTGFALVVNKGANSEDWSTVNAQRYAPAVNDTPAIIGGVNEVTMGDRSWSIEPGAYNMVFDYNAMELTITEYVEPDDVIVAEYNFTDVENIYKMNPTIPNNSTWEYNSNANWYALNGQTLSIDGSTLHLSNGTASGNGWTTRIAIRNGTTSTTLRMPRGTEMTVEVPEGYAIESIVFSGSSASNISPVTPAEGQSGQMTASSTDPWTNTWTPAEVMAAAADNSSNIVRFTSIGAGIIQGITVTASKIEEEPITVPMLYFDTENVVLNIMEGAEEPVEVEIPVSIQLPEGMDAIEYAGFEFDFTLPEWVGTPNLKVNEPFEAIDVRGQKGQFKALATLDFPTVSNVIENIATLTISTTFDQFGQPEGEYEEALIITAAGLSTHKGEDIKAVGAESTLAVNVTELPEITKIEIVNVGLNLPSYMSNFVPSITVGEELNIEVKVWNENDEVVDDAVVTWTAYVNNETVDYITTVDNESANSYDVVTKEANIEDDTVITLVPSVGTFVGSDNVAFTLRPVVPGDANDNGEITVADVVTTANYIVAEVDEDNGNKVNLADFVVRFDEPNADVTGDNQINDSDVTAIVNMIIGNYGRTARALAGNINTNDALIVDDFQVYLNRPFTIGVGLFNSYEYAALQGEIEIPAGMQVVGVSAGPRAAAHKLVYNVTSNGNVRFILYSNTNDAFANGAGSLLNIQVTANEECGNVAIKNVHASDAASNGYVLTSEGGINQSQATGIYGVDVEEGAVRYFTVDGVEIQNPQAGQIVIRMEGGKAVKEIVK